MRLPIAVAPDGSAFATVTGRYGQPRVLVVMDTRTGVTRFSRTLPDDVSIAGSAAWAPDGRILLLTGCGWEGEICGGPWHTRSVDAVTGKETAEPYAAANGRPFVLGWRSGRPFMAVQHLNSCTFMVGNDPVSLAVPRARCPEIPRTVAEEAALGGPPLAPSFWAAQWWFYPLVFGVSLGLVSVAWRWRTRSRRMRRGTRA